jgi:hypothetical protein
MAGVAMSHVPFFVLIRCVFLRHTAHRKSRQANPAALGMRVSSLETRPLYFVASAFFMISPSMVFSTCFHQASFFL